MLIICLVETYFLFQSINEMLGQQGNSSKDIVLGDINVKETVNWKEIKNDDGGSYFWNIQTNGLFVFI